MVFIDGFWTGFLTGGLVVLAFLFILAFHSFVSEQRAKTKMMEMIEGADIYVHKNEKGDSDNESEDY